MTIAASCLLYFVNWCCLIEKTVHSRKYFKHFHHTNTGIFIIIIFTLTKFHISVIDRNSLFEHVIYFSTGLAVLLLPPLTPPPWVMGLASTHHWHIMQWLPPLSQDWQGQHKSSNSSRSNIRIILFHTYSPIEILVFNYLNINSSPNIHPSHQIRCKVSFCTDPITHTKYTVGWAVTSAYSQ